MSATPIADHALLSDCHSAALVSRAGSIDWLCFPRFDSPSVFARLLDDDAGHWSLRPRSDHRVERRYVDGTLALVTRFITADGVVELHDLLAVGPNDQGHQLGAESPHVLLRSLRGVEGKVEMLCEVAPRPEYGLVQPLLVADEDGILGRGGPSVLRLSLPFDLEVEGSVARGAVTVEAGDRVDLALQYRAAWEELPKAWSPMEMRERGEATIRAWRSWSERHQGYEGPWQELVWLSGRVLQGLTYFPTGAIVAAPTTSLPETVGGARNWDYRYCWIRDASLTLHALWVAACPDEAHKFFDFMETTSQVPEGGDHQIMFGIGGEHDLSERQLDHLGGWRGSRPVRIGNGAWNQKQLDVYGQLLGAAARLRDQLGELDAVRRSWLTGLADQAASRWRETDHGIWEMRDECRHFLYSKLMCWFALDRAVELADLLEAEAETVERWRTVAAEIRQEILERGWNESVGAFTQSFGSDALDASALTMPIVGFIDADDRRMRATIEKIEEQLTDERGLVHRYAGRDGLDGDEGSFLLCTFWLAHAWALADEVARARRVYERAITHVNDVGLLAEEVATESGELLGNFPQAFSHVGLVNAAWAIAEAERRAEAHGTA